MMLGKDRIFDLRDDRIIKSYNPRQYPIARLQVSNKVFPHLLMHRQYWRSALSKLPNRFCKIHVECLPVNSFMVLICKHPFLFTPYRTLCNPVE